MATNTVNSDMLSSTPKPIKLSACPMMHVKFEYGEEQDQIDIINVRKKAILKREDEIVNLIIDNNDSTEVINVDTSECKDDTEVIDSITINSSIDQNQLLSKDILKAPLMHNLLPKTGDIISFKVSTTNNIFNKIKFGTKLDNTNLQKNISAQKNKRVQYIKLNNLFGCFELPRKIYFNMPHRLLRIKLFL